MTRRQRPPLFPSPLPMSWSGWNEQGVHGRGTRERERYAYTGRGIYDILELAWEDASREDGWMEISCKVPLLVCRIHTYTHTCTIHAMKEGNELHRRYHCDVDVLSHLGETYERDDEW